jgi:hypothetical protein
MNDDVRYLVSEARRHLDEMTAELSREHPRPTELGAFARRASFVLAELVELTDDMPVPGASPAVLAAHPSTSWRCRCGAHAGREVAACPSCGRPRHGGVTV